MDRNSSLSALRSKLLALCPQPYAYLNIALNISDALSLSAFDIFLRIEVSAEVLMSNTQAFRQNDMRLLVVTVEKISPSLIALRIVLANLTTFLAVSLSG